MKFFRSYLATVFQMVPILRLMFHLYILAIIFILSFSGLILAIVYLIEWGMISFHFLNLLQKMNSLTSMPLFYHLYVCAYISISLYLYLWMKQCNYHFHLGKWAERHFSLQSLSLNWMFYPPWEVIILELKYKIDYHTV